MKRTKIISTLGPATNNKDTLSELMTTGADFIRLNGSHYRSKDQIAKDVKLLKTVSKSIKKEIPFFFDLQGPKIRIGQFENDGTVLKTGQSFQILPDDTIMGTNQYCGLTTPEIINDLNAGEPIFIDDGNIRLTIDSITDHVCQCTVLQGGKISNFKGVNLPGSTISVSAITDKDRDDIKTAIKHKADYIALSFVSKAEDVHELRELIKQSSQPNIGIISKIERKSAIADLENIIDASDIIMVARGDLGVEIGLEKVPEIQKNIIRECNRLTTPVIVATQMLESMVYKPTATRAEVSDVANAIYDRCDAVMLSAETAVGDFPIETVQTMANICTSADQHLAELKLNRYSQVRRVFEQKSNATTFCKAADQISEEVHANAIIAFTSSGSTALTASKLNPSVPIIAPTDNIDVLRKMNLYRAVIPIMLKTPFSRIKSWSAMIDIALNEAKSLGYVSTGDLAVVTAGYPIGTPGGTNSIRLITVK